MNAVLYKLKQLLKCNQSYYHNCLSSNGLFSLYKVPHTLDYKCDPIYDIIQKSICNDYQKPVVKSITSWNIQELFWHCYERDKLANIISYIKQSTSDVVCLQEAFEISTIDAIVYDTEIKDKYPYFLSGSLANRFIVGENSGLLVLSRYPIIFKQFTPFHKTSFPDGFASKGALYFSTGGVNIITTHLQSENNAIACMQLNKILSNNPFTNRAFLIGDLNLEFPQVFTNTSINNKRITCENGQILDHIINLSHDIDFDVEVDYFDITQYSDHYPLIARLN
jgi:endonuclease/exonuclease/phosphatase family metal-dependent hydrolase